MRIFIIPGHRVITNGDFSLNDLSGSTGRLDILLRCVNSAFFLSNGIRTDVEIVLINLGPPDPPKSIKFVGSELRYLNPDERSTGALVRTAIMRPCGSEWIKSTPGIYISRKGLDEIIKEYLLPDRQIIYLKETGELLQTAKFSNPIFVLGDQFDLSAEEEKVIFSSNAKTISLGPKSLHSDHCITIINNELDRRMI